MPRPKFRSNLEKYCYDYLKKKKIPFKYEPGRILLQEPFKYTGVCIERVKSRGKVNFKEASPNIRKITYTPDFVGEGWIIETKGFERPVSKLKWKLFKKHLIDNDLTEYDLYKPHTQKEIRECVDMILSNKKMIFKPLKYD